MPGFLPDALPTGIFAFLATILLRARAGKPRLASWKLLLIAVGAAWLIPHTLALLAEAWRATPALPALPVLTSGKLFIGGWVGLLALALSIRPNGPPRLPLWGVGLAGLGAAILLPPLLDLATGSYQRASLHADMNRCIAQAEDGAPGYRITNACDEPIVLGLCLPSEVNPAPCAQSHSLRPGETAELDPRGTPLASLPGAPDGHTIVACRPPARPSRMVSELGRGHEGVCLPPG